MWNFNNAKVSSTETKLWWNRKNHFVYHLSYIRHVQKMWYRVKKKVISIRVIIKRYDYYVCWSDMSSLEVKYHYCAYNRQICALLLCGPTDRSFIVFFDLLVGYYCFFSCTFLVTSMSVLCSAPLPVSICCPPGLLVTGSCCWVVRGLRSLNAAIPYWSCLLYCMNHPFYAVLYLKKKQLNIKNNFKFN
jgi:hypothetical protein